MRLQPAIDEAPHSPRGLSIGVMRPLSLTTTSQPRMREHACHFLVIGKGRDGILFTANDQHRARETSEHYLAIRSVQRVLPNENVPTEALVHGPKPADEVAILQPRRMHIGRQHSIGDAFELAWE